MEVLSANNHTEPWPYTYGIWGEEVDELGLEHLLEHRWKNTVSFFGPGSCKARSNDNKPTKHEHDYGLFDKNKLQAYWLAQCNRASIEWNKGSAINLKQIN